jgi:hypothetical protein
VVRYAKPLVSEISQMRKPPHNQAPGASDEPKSEHTKCTGAAIFLGTSSLHALRELLPLQVKERSRVEVDCEPQRVMLSVLPLTTGGYQRAGSVSSVRCCKGAAMTRAAELSQIIAATAVVGARFRLEGDASALLASVRAERKGHP